MLTTAASRLSKASAYRRLSSYARRACRAADWCIAYQRVRHTPKRTRAHKTSGYPRVCLRRLTLRLSIQPLMCAERTHLLRISVDDGTLVFTSARAIQAGEACTIAYTATEEPTYIRRQLLNRTKHFICRCVKCGDPLECDTYSSCLRCTNCVSGWQLPVLSPPTCHLADLRSLQSDEEGEEEEDEDGGGGGDGVGVWSLWLYNAS